MIAVLVSWPLGTGTGLPAKSWQRSAMCGRLLLSRFVLGNTDGYSDAATQIGYGVRQKKQQHPL